MHRRGHTPWTGSRPSRHRGWSRAVAFRLRLPSAHGRRRAGTRRAEGSRPIKITQIPCSLLTCWFRGCLRRCSAKSELPERDERGMDDGPTHPAGPPSQDLHQPSPPDGPCQWPVGRRCPRPSVADDVCDVWSVILRPLLMSRAPWPLTDDLPQPLHDLLSEVAHAVSPLRFPGAEPGAGACDRHPNPNSYLPRADPRPAAHPTFTQVTARHIASQQMDGT